MPNWCMNKLLVSGDKEQVKNFIIKAKSEQSVLTFTNFFPCPEVLSYFNSFDEVKTFNQFKKITNKIMFDTELNYIHLFPVCPELKQYLQTKYGVCDEYQWCIRYFGTKSNFGHSAILNPKPFHNSTNPKAQYYFYTSWSPPIEFIKNVSGLYPKLSFSLWYYEPGMGIEGYCEYTETECLTEREYLTDDERNELEGE